MKLNHKAVLFVALAMTQSVYATCKLADIELKVFRASFVNDCRASPCYSLKGVAVLTNKCNQATGVELQIIGYDEDKIPVATRNLWPASVNNIAPGDYTFSVDSWLEYNPSIKSFTLQPVRIQQRR